MNSAAFMRILNQMALLLEQKQLFLPSSPAGWSVLPGAPDLLENYCFAIQKDTFYWKDGKDQGGLEWGILSWKKGSEKHSEWL